VRRTRPAKVTVYPRCTARRGELTFDLAQGNVPRRIDFGLMAKRDQSNETEAKEPKPSRLEEARQIVE
jgi:hypothetical protein